MWKIIAFSIFLLSNPAQAFLCNTYLSTLPTKLLLKKKTIELTTPSEDSTDRVKLLLKASQESWLKYGRPDRLSTGTLAPLFLEHFFQLTQTETNIVTYKDRFSSEQEYKEILKQIRSLQTELKEIQNRKYVDQKQIFYWGRKAGQLNNYILALKENRDSYHTAGFVDAITEYTDSFSRIGFFPLANGRLEWQELNDLWIAGIAVAGLTTESEIVDGNFMRPMHFLVHDYSHASTLSFNMPFYSPARISKLYHFFLSYNKFRNLQTTERDLRKKSIREGIMFFMLHDSNEFPFKESFEKILTENKDTIKNRFISGEAEYGSSFKPDIRFTEIYQEIDWFLSTLRWSEI